MGHLATMPSAYFSTDMGVFYLGNAYELMPLVPSESVDLVLTDPPYGVGSGEASGFSGYVDRGYDVPFVSKELWRILKPDSRAFVFVAQKNLVEVITGFVSSGFTLHQILVWHRPNLFGGTKKKTYEFTNVYENILVLHKGKPPKLKKVEGLHNTDILKYAMPQGNFVKDRRYHVHQKPLDLIRHLVLVSTEPGQLVFDPFAGSGTTAVASESTGRRWMCFELEPHYFEVARVRVSKESRIPNI